MSKMSEIDVLEKKFEEWRKHRTSLTERIPNRLIRSAVKLEKSGEYGKCQMLRRLRLSFKDYEQKKNALLAETGPKFVTTSLPQSCPVNKEQKIEVQMGIASGLQIKLFCSAGEEESLARLVKSIALGADPCSR